MVGQLQIAGALPPENHRIGGLGGGGQSRCGFFGEEIMLILPLSESNHDSLDVHPTSRIEIIFLNNLQIISIH
jgi:hypothetical protein